MWIIFDTSGKMHNAEIINVFYRNIELKIGEWYEYDANTLTLHTQ